MKHVIGLALACSLGLALPLDARAADDSFDPLQAGGVKEDQLTVVSNYKAELAIAGVLQAKKEDVLVCYGAVASPSSWQAVIDLGTRFSTLIAGQAAQQAARAELKKQQSTLEQAKSKLVAAEQTLTEATNAQSEWAKRTDPAATEKKIAADNALASAKAGQVVATQDVAVATKAVATATTKLAALQVTDTSGDKAAPQSLRDEFASALAVTENSARSPANFRAAVKDAKRRAACLRYTTAVNAAFNSTSAAKNAPDANEEQTARVKARIEDTIGKTTDVASAVTGSSSALEQPGAPERVVYTVMSALGADSKTTGSQLLMTLNLASIGSSDSAKPVDNVFLRNLFLRVGLPLQSGSSTSQAAAVATTPSSAMSGSATPATTPEVKRLSFVLGGSLADASDPRLATHDECFDFVKAYVPLALNETESKARVAERQLYYGSCAQIAANRDRLAWRAGLGLVTTKDADRETTKPEVIAGALVYGPSDWVLFNAIGQRLLEPYVVNTVGGGVSLNIDAGGETPGSQWGRLSLDAIGLAEFRPRDASAGVASSKSWEARLSVTGSGKVATGGVAQFSIGPRILSSGDVGLFSTVALTYDADQLINQLLVPPAASTQ